MKHTLVAILASVGMVGAVAAQERMSQAPQKSQQQAPQGEVPAGEVMLGTVNIPRAVTADGKPLPSGQYQVRLTAQEPQPDVPGIQMARWVEFVRGGQVRGREVVSIIPAAEMKDLMPGPDPGRAVTNGSRVEMLKSRDYVRVWINRRGVNYLLHMPPAA